MKKDLKILIIGLGSMGRRYIDILQRYDHQIYTLRSGYGLEPTPAGVTEVRGWHDIGATPDIAFICNPSHLHTFTAIECAKRGINLFIEKPIDTSTYKLGQLVQIVREKGLAAYVAYPFRFHEGLYQLMRLRHDQRLVRHNLLYPKDVQIVCKTNYKKWQPYHIGQHMRHNDGVLLELSHEIDIVEWFFGSIMGIRGYFGDTTADLMIKCANVEYEIRVLLDMESDDEERYLMFDGDCFHYAADGEMYEHQVEYYLDNFVKPSTLINKLEDAQDMFCRLIYFRDVGEENGRDTCDDMCSGRVEGSTREEY